MHLSIYISSQSDNPTIFGILLQINALFLEKIFIFQDTGVIAVSSILLFIIVKDKGGKYMSDR